jgi:hypothetical protein
MTVEKKNRPTTVYRRGHRPGAKLRPGAARCATADIGRRAYSDPAAKTSVSVLLAWEASRCACRPALPKEDDSWPLISRPGCGSGQRPPLDGGGLCGRPGLTAQGLADGGQYINEVSGTSHVAHQRHVREHFHLFAGDVVDPAQTIVLAEFVPRRSGAAGGLL